MGLLLTFLLLVLSTTLVLAALTDGTLTTHNTSLGMATVADEPRGRGTFGIIFCSPVTFLFCVWTAVNPNIITGASIWNRVCYKSILIISILVPEGSSYVRLGSGGRRNDSIGLGV